MDKWKSGGIHEILNLLPWRQWIKWEIREEMDLFERCRIANPKREKIVDKTSLDNLLKIAKEFKHFPFYFLISLLKLQRQPNPITSQNISDRSFFQYIVSTRP